MVAFIDASALIYLSAGRGPFAQKVRAMVTQLLQEHAPLGVSMSRLSWLECRIAPMKANDATALAAYDAFFSRTDLLWVELTREVVELATAIRVRHGLRTPDALQAASCLQLGAGHVMLTGNAAFGRRAARVPRRRVAARTHL